jgi:hypothetical protein
MMVWKARKNESDSAKTQVQEDEVKVKDQLGHLYEHKAMSDGDGVKNR